MNNPAFCELLALLMVYDHHQAGDAVPVDALKRLADQEAQRRGYESWVVAYHMYEMGDDAPETGPRSPMTPLPGIAAKTVVISSACRRGRGETEAVDEALAQIRTELLRTLPAWPHEKGATFFVCATVDRHGRRELGGLR